MDSALRESAFDFGRQRLAPIFAAFAELLLREAGRRDVGRLLFLARDGSLLMEATRGMQLPGKAPAIELRYVHISRRVAMLSALQTLTPDALRAADAIRAGAPSLRKQLEFHGIDPAPLEQVLARHRLSADDALPDSTIDGLLTDADFRRAIAEQASASRRLLGAYLGQACGNAERPRAWVDIGWRGTIQACVESGLAGEETSLPGFGFYLGLWSENESLPRAPNSLGLLCDRRRGRGPLEASAWHAAHLLEAICRANEGTTIGYRAGEKTVVPVLCDDARRGAEIVSDRFARRIREGVLAGIGDLAASATWRERDDRTLRREAQHGLLSLTFFPGASEVELGRQLVHSEGHAGDWSLPMILPGVSPWLAPRRWLAGLGSPWRAGYAAATGGWPFAVGYLGFETAMGYLPAPWRLRLANFARRLSGITPVPKA